MKIQFEIEMTPEELRRLFGLPDVSKIQDQMLEQMSEKIQNADLETMKNLMKPFIFDGLKSGAENYQHFVGTMLKMATLGKLDLTGKDDEDMPADEQNGKPASRRKKS
ncbi:MAG TPA: DUF6489 family protein [Pseudomonadales bacterium]